MRAIEHVLHDEDGWMVGKGLEFERRLTKGTWYHSGVLEMERGEVALQEVWERCDK